MQEFFENGIVPYLHLSETMANVYLVIVFALCIFIPYLLGSVNSVKAAKSIFHEDFGSDFTLASYLHSSGWRHVLLAALFDFLKTGITILFAIALMGCGRLGFYEYNMHIYVALAFLIAGDIFPVFNRFHGGHGALIGFLSISYLSLSCAAIVLLLSLAFLFMSKYTSLSIFAGALAYPLFYTKLFQAMVPGYQAPGQNVLCVFFISLLLVISYIPNIKRIMNKEEPHFYLHKDRGGDL